MSNINEWLNEVRQRFAEAVRQQDFFEGLSDDYLAQTLRDHAAARPAESSDAIALLLELARRLALHGRTTAALRKLLDRDALRWKHNGYGKLSCTSCGALAWEDPGEHSRNFYRTEDCSPSCPWRVAEELLGTYIKKKS